MPWNLYSINLLVHVKKLIGQYSVLDQSILQVSNMEKEQEEHQMKMSQLQMKNKSLKSELEETEQQLDDSEVSWDGLFEWSSESLSGCSLNFLH